MIYITKKLITCILSVINLIFFNNFNALCDDTPVLPEVLVTSQRSGRFINSRGTESLVLTRDEITALQAGTIPELLSLIASIDVRERGTPGSQADISIRGSSSEGVLILVNGIEVRDPQTGHFTMDIPADLSRVEKIEVLRGGGSTMYGSRATGGVINIITGDSDRGVNGSVSVGSFGSTGTSAGLSYSRGSSDMSVNVKRGISDGYKRGTDYESTEADIMGSYRSDTVKIGWNMGILDKRFGAEGFYSLYPSFEKTLTLLGGISFQQTINSRNLVRIRAGARGHGDDFLLDRDNPEDYRNTHYNSSFVYSGEYLTYPTNIYSAIVGFETERTGIMSGSLDVRSDRNNAMYGELTADASKAQVSVSLRYDSGFRDEHCFTQGVGISVPVTFSTRFRLRAEKSFRSPTYTELYYNSPANRGNPDLRSEYSRSVEAGLDHTGERISYGMVLFARESSDVIDWIRWEGETEWKAENHGKINTPGIEMNARVSMTETWIFRVSGMVLNQSVERRQGVESKYILNSAARSITGAVTGILPLKTNCSFTVRYEERLHGDSRIPVTVSCTRPFGNFTPVITVRNLLNDRYDVFPGLPAPGRWYTFRLEYNR
ncbi:TonB-dependent receptor [bacterium]|nr:TonB-dependent receptor [bacterium]